MPRFKGKKKKNYPKERRNVEEGFIPQEFIDYYHFQFVPKVLSEDEFQIMINTLKQPLSHTFRIVGNPFSSTTAQSTTCETIIVSELLEVQQYHQILNHRQLSIHYAQNCIMILNYF